MTNLIRIIKLISLQDGYNILDDNEKNFLKLFNNLYAIKDENNNVEYRNTNNTNYSFI